MDIIIKGGPIPSTTFGQPLTPMIVEPTFGSGRVALKPDEFNGNGFNGGFYRWAGVTGALTGVAAAGAIFSFRSPPSGLSTLKRVQVGYAITTPFTTGQLIDLDIIRCTGFTASDTGGSPFAPFTGNNNKKRTALFNTSQISDLRIATTAALGAGTKTQDASPFGYVFGNETNLAVPTATVQGGSLPAADIYAQNTNGEHPETFQPNEGFNIRMVTPMGAAGTIKVYVVVDWGEVPGI
jgi:hypothetical protein